ncbi:dephospho-CoA kinase [Candidatus Woesearchaeota archaeon]|nr:dephospho-CoA kinase [Candidatus Woesearchaeota archaeon]
MIIGLTGTIGSGKGDLARYLENKGFQRIVFSDILKDELIKRGIEITRENLQLMGDEFRKQGDLNVLARKLLEKITRENVVLDGIRNPGEVDYLKKNSRFVLIGIDADEHTRFERTISRGDARDPKTYREFRERDEKDRRSINPEGQQVDLCLQQADYKIFNNTTIEEFHAQIESVLIQIKNKKYQHTGADEY